MIIWFASLVGHYKAYNLESAYLADLEGDQEPLSNALSQFVSAHPSKSSRRFIEWFIETGLFRDWLRRKVIFCLLPIPSALLGVLAVYRKQLCIYFRFGTIC